ncbi:high-affinity nickel-transport protein [Paenibacillus sp. 1_12]|uniref:HoxN/HupN/NixA family nickel/cobalt transporter n=1 Tax=Paenibacillus sp. 1_12 TaxID=1566278 RepID=UPI0008F3FA5C|nr:HoxN/HupN/NixA family nickel/cobalt transporter [Paenibacillus sp. 1_12]SFK89555.1 high-affinity nickel-transport protein [Paenibacillus sp. 1_12]
MLNNGKFNHNKSWLGYSGAVLCLHIIGIVFLYVAASHNPALWGMGLLAYTLGLRHAFDVDHIAAIDNTVRKLVQQKRNSFGVGFYFSLGHSSVVLLMAIVTAFSVKWVQRELPEMQEIGGLIGASVSGLFLLIIGIINLIVLIQLFQLFVQFRKGAHNQDEFEKLLESRGFFSRLLRPLYKFITRSWHVYPLGFLFGLGFDTASEISLLAISAGAAKEAMPFVGVLSFPILFAAGMSLMDTADGIFMTKAYSWAFSTPHRKLYYNLSVTSLAVVAALLIGMVELLQVLSEKLGMNGAFWNWIQDLDFGSLGYMLVILFVLAWAISVGIWKGMRLEERWGAGNI